MGKDLVVPPEVKVIVQLVPDCTLQVDCSAYGEPLAPGLWLLTKVPLGAVGGVPLVVAGLLVLLVNRYHQQRFSASYH
jgi:hypothetical protein